MVITKNSKVAKIFSELLKDVLTPRAIGDVSYVSFVEGKGYVVKFDNGSLGTIFIKDATVEFTGTVNNSIISAVTAALKNAEEVNVQKVEDGIKVADKWVVTSLEGSTSFDFTEVSRATISFTPEQYNKLERDFDLTVGNYFSNQKNVDTIGFVNDEGAVKIIATGASIYKISNEPDATIDSVYAEQTLGHATRIYLIPRRIFNITKYFDNNLKVDLTSGNDVYFDSDTVAMRYTAVGYGVNQYQINKNDCAASDDGIEISSFKEVVSEFVDPILENKFENSDDQNIEINASNGKMKITVGNNASVTIDSSLEFKLSANAEVISYLCKNYPECKIKEIADNYYQVKNGNDYLRFQSNKV